MKRLFSLTVLALALSFALYSCKDSSLDSDTVTTTDNYSTAAYLIPNMELESGVLTEASESCEAKIEYHEGLAMDSKRHGDRGKGIDSVRPPFHGKFFTLGKVLAKLELTDDQKTQLEVFMTAHRECELQARLALRTAQAAIIEPANASRKAILLQLKNGEITRDSAKAAIKAINVATRTALETDTAVLAAKAALKDCKDLLLTNIASILTPEQLVIWTEYLSKIKG